MLDIQINGTSLDLFADTVLTFEQYNPLFQIEVGAEGYSYPIDLPASNQNRIIFGFIENIQSTASFKDYDCTVVINNTPKHAVFTILKASESRLTCSIYIGLFDKNVLDKSLQDINFNGIRTITDMVAHANDLKTKSVDTSDYVFFPIKNSKFYGDSNANQPDFSGIINDYRNGTFTSYATSFDSTGDAVIQTVNCFIPFPYLIFVLKRIASELGKTLTGSFVNNTEIRKLAIYNTYALDEIRTDPLSNIEGNIFAQTINLKNHVPNFTVRELLNALINKFNVAISITHTDLHIIFKQDILTALEDDDYSDIVEAELSLEPFKKVDTLGYTFTDVVDTNDESLTDFSKIIVKDGTIQGTVDEWYNLFLPAILDNLCFAINRNNYYRAIEAGNTGNTQNQYELYPGVFNAATYKVGRGDEKIESKISTLLMQKHIPVIQEYPDIADFVLLPEATQKGNSPVSDYGIGTDNPFSLRLLFYRGMQPTDLTGSKTYPLGTNNTYSAISGAYNVTGAIGTLSLQWGNTNGLYKNCHEQWLELIAKAKAVNISLGMTPVQWAKFDWFKPKHMLSQSIIFEKITFTIAANGFRKATARVLKR